MLSLVGTEGLLLFSRVVVAATTSAVAGKPWPIEERRSG